MTRDCIELLSEEEFAQYEESVGEASAHLSFGIDPTLDLMDDEEEKSWR